MSLSEIKERWDFWRTADRISQEIPTTYWRLYFKDEMHKFCSKKFANFGFNAEFRPGAFAEACSKISIGCNVVIRPGTFLFADPSDGGGTITIEDDVLIGPGVHFYTNNHSYSNPEVAIFEQGYPTPNESDSIIIRKGSWIGAGSIILPGVEVGENSVIGAGSVVTKSVLPRTVNAGNPARIIKKIP